MDVDVVDGSAAFDASAALDVSAPFFDNASVASLEGLSLWLDASRGVSDPTVETWHDQSPNADAAVAVAGSLTPDYLRNELNGYPAVQLQGTATMTVTGPHAGAAAAFGTAEFLVEIVTRWDRDSTFLQTDHAFVVSGDTEASMTVGTTPLRTAGANLGDGTFHVVGARRSGVGASTRLDLRVDGAVAATVTSADDARDLGGAADTPVATLGPGNDAELVELVVVKGPISSANLSGLEGYLRAKYALP
ncbi:MAG TPA: hypothetical protein VH560_16145 [Polyangia bacterium]|nr:hypothetical protein [Polyangia bacterium]